MIIYPISNANNEFLFLYKARHFLSLTIVSKRVKMSSVEIGVFRGFLFQIIKLASNINLIIKQETFLC